MAFNSIVDIEALIHDLRLAVGYASKAGLLHDRKVLDVVKAADLALRREDPASVDIEALTTALSEVAQIIAPITLADLKFGRDPFSPENQARSKLLQLGLAIFALLVLGTVGTFTHWLQRDQSLIQAVQQIDDYHPQLKLNALRNMAQHEKPLDAQSALYEVFHQKVSELRQVNGQLYIIYSDTMDPRPLFKQLLLKALPASGSHADPSDNTSPVNGLDKKKSETVVEEARGVNLAKGSSGSGELVSIASTVDLRPADADKTLGMDEPIASAGASPPLCAEDAAGEIRLPTGSASLPAWMKAVLKDALDDFCFQLNVVSPLGDGASPDVMMPKLLQEVSKLKRDIDLRVSWFLPFLFGLLGSTVYMMRNVASVRTPSMELFPMIMRLSLGGVAGIVIGWFTAAAGGGAEITKTLSLPFALAFLVGYGIDSLFSLLDRLNRMIGDTPKTA